ncbi:MAG: AraC family transcriptional regulator [Clostridiaceae bacterium]
MDKVDQNSGKTSSEKRGYLKRDFEIFHIKDKKSIEFKYHHHDFHKIVFFISGGVTYHIEDKAYDLEPWDILLVGNTEMHKPVIDGSKVYERIVLWVYPDFLKRNNTPRSNLLECFQISKERNYHRLRCQVEELSEVKSLLKELLSCKTTEDYGTDIMEKLLFLKLMVELNRLFLKKVEEKEEEGIGYDKNITALINYINKNLSEDLSIDKLSARFYLSRYYLMHKFKEETGSSIYSFIIQKRLIRARELMREGTSITEASLLCGFKDYSTFVKAFKKSYSCTPRDYLKELNKPQVSKEGLQNMDF